MTLLQLRDDIKDFAKDLRLNLSSLFGDQEPPGLSKAQLWGVALSCAYATKNSKLIGAILEDPENVLTDAEKNASKAAAALMAMNNIYYRSLHLLENKELGKMPARLRMNVLQNPGVAKADFEAYSLGVSAIFGCGACLNAHTHDLTKLGMSLEGVQTILRIAAIIHGVSLAIDI